MIFTTLAEQQHQALVAYYIHHVIAKDAALKDKVTDVDALYEYLLIDPGVTQKVTTSRVGEAIASLQQYLGRISQDLEPGLKAQADEIEKWQQWQHRYSLWAGLRQLESHPENYLDPAMRQYQTAEFTTLLQTLSQGKLQENSIKKGILEYLNNFETISNLKILSAYQSGKDVNSARFYFIGRTYTSPMTFYIRCLDLSETNGKENLKPSLNAWGNWEQINLPLNGAEDKSIRPMYRNGRLYIAWAENKQLQNEQGKKTDQCTLRLGQQQLDGNWSICFEQSIDDFSCNFVMVGNIIAAGFEGKSMIGLSLAGSPKSKGFVLDDLLNSQPDSGVAAGMIAKYKGEEGGATSGDTIFLVQKDLDLTHNNNGSFCQLKAPEPAVKPTANKDDANKSETDEEKPADNIWEDKWNSLRYMSTYGDQARNYPLTTQFASQMVPRAHSSLGSLFSWETQHLTEPAVVDGEPDVSLDFNGAYGRYFWELFLYVPWLIANHYTAQLNFSEAQSWLNRLFTPHKKEGRYWQVRPLQETGMENARLKTPNDANAMAVAHPIYYKKALFANRIRFLMEQGDALYRELSRDGLNEAKQFYVQALTLLGGEPQRATAQRWQPVTLGELSQTSNQALRQLEQRLPGSELPLQADDYAAAHYDAPFLLPQDSGLQQLWDDLQTRMYNLRHFLTLDGKPLTLPLYDAPGNPAELQRRLASGQSLNGTGSANSLMVPPFRFQVMHTRAQSAVETLIQFGNQLQGFMERQDQLKLDKLQLTHQKELLPYTLDLQQQAIDMGDQSLAALRESKRSATTRYDHYKKLYDENISDDESKAMTHSIIAGALYSGASYAFAGGEALDLFPNTFGMANGGQRWGGAARIPGYLMQGVASALNTVAGNLQSTAMYHRRRQDWEIQYRLAEHEKTQIDAQIKAQEKQNAQYAKQLAQTRFQGQQFNQLLEFWAQRVSNVQLYQWLIGQLRGLFRQARDAAVSLCKATEAAWRCDTGWFNEPSPLRADDWNEARYGLLCGENLKLGLLQMEQKYLLRHERHLELTHTLSLKELIGQKAWDQVVKTSQGDAKFTFSLNEKAFAQRYPGLYQRRIVQITLSVPAVIGPYQNISALLTQTSSHFLLKADAGDFARLAGGEITSANIRSNLRASQQVALSSGFEDGGLFVENLADERYLPFEGNGVHSSWELSFPNVAGHPAQKQLLERMTDVIVKVRYRALNGGDAFAKAVCDAMKPKPE
ncbi:hypothetical protein GW590_02460 [Rahnella sp. SAP-1]|uniref:Uncharacterized protein n=1 Tax=Rouxiella aceris TaxID=2703884 RepID=A0A848MF58_9GAMM|nr:neuraminidase-like domain-containing protein [Rouxiella aceris]NMP25740.1 hypothetical protein [Rouxiella aceris]